MIGIAGPRNRLTIERIEALAQALRAAEPGLAATRGASARFGRLPLGKG